MYHLRLKSQRCSCAQVHHYYLAINFSVQFTFALQHRNATDSSQRVTAVAMLFGDNVRSKFTHSQNATCNWRPGFDRCDENTLKFKALHLWNFRCEFTQYFPKTIRTKRKTITMDVQAQLRIYLRLLID